MTVQNTEQPGCLLRFQLRRRSHFTPGHSLLSRDDTADRTLCELSDVFTSADIRPDSALMDLFPAYVVCADKSQQTIHVYVL